MYPDRCTTLVHESVGNWYDWPRIRIDSELNRALDSSQHWNGEERQPVGPKDEIWSYPHFRLPPAMDPVTSHARLVRFEAFEFDRHTLELRKHGLKIKLSGLPQPSLRNIGDSPCPRGCPLRRNTKP